MATGADTDDNATDFTEAAPTPTNARLGPAALSLTNPGTRTNTVGDTVNLQLAASGGTGAVHLRRDQPARPG